MLYGELRLYAAVRVRDVTPFPAMFPCLPLSAPGKKAVIPLSVLTALHIYPFFLLSSILLYLQGVLVLALDFLNSLILFNHSCLMNQLTSSTYLLFLAFTPTFSPSQCRLFVSCEKLHFNQQFFHTSLCNMLLVNTKRHFILWLSSSHMHTLSDVKLMNTE